MACELVIRTIADSIEAGMHMVKPEVFEWGPAVETQPASEEAQAAASEPEGEPSAAAPPEETVPEPAGTPDEAPPAREEVPAE
jgi:hypothetical protein